MIVITCRGRSTIMGKSAERHDILPIDSYAIASQTPKLYAIFVPKTQRFTLDLIRQSRVFCANVIEGHAASVAFCKRTPGEHVDKFKETDFIPAECESIDCPRIDQAKERIECELFEERLIGDHVMFVGSVRKQQP
ncbi:flavin reductase [Candidatus Woesearchaeota archaeon]|nr:flavin reductase [Candidatus Woesearchaeota archaeon]